MNTAAELAQGLHALATSTDNNLTADERAALEDAAQRLDKGQGPVAVIGRLLAPFLRRLRPSKAPEAPGFAQLDLELDTTRWDAAWSRHLDNRPTWRGPKAGQ